MLTTFFLKFMSYREREGGRGREKERERERESTWVSKYININYSVQIILFVCMFSGLTIGF
jgi:hypothetical protein